MKLTLSSEFADDLPPELPELLKQPQQLIQQSSIIKDDKSTTVAKFSHDGKEYIIKRFNARNGWHRIKRALRKTRAACCWLMSHQYTQAGILAPKPVARLEYHYGPFKSDSFFISEFIQGQELLEWLPKQNAKVINQVTTEIQKIFRLFYENRLSHGDMKATNLLWSDGKLLLIDLDVARQHSIKLTFLKAHERDKKRFRRNGELFAQMLAQ